MTRSPCHNVEMVGGPDYFCCPTCGAWMKAGTEDEQAKKLMEMFGMDSSSPKR